MPSSKGISVTAPLDRLGARHLSEYIGVVERLVLDRIHALARPLAGLRVLHLSAGPLGSGVADTLASLVPLQRDVGLVVDWKILHGAAPQAWGRLYQGLAGTPTRWGRKQQRAWRAHAERYAHDLQWDYDVVVIHDPQPLALAEVVGPRVPSLHWVWHCHLDTRSAPRELWTDLGSVLHGFDAAVFPSEELVRPDLVIPTLGITRPALDPVAPRNRPLDAREIARTLDRLGLDAQRPIIGQFAPIEHRYTPIAALGTYWLARRTVPGLQVVLVEDPSAALVRQRRDLEEVRAAAANDPDIHVLAAEQELGAREVNALQRSVTAALQLAVPGGFSRGLAECQLKGKPAVVGRLGQLAAQAGDGAEGFVVDGAPGAAEVVIRLLRDPGLAREVGARGKARQLRDHLITGLLLDYLRVFHRVVEPLYSTKDIQRQAMAVGAHEAV